jgi:23S rRNA pseudouridine2605 synthase
LREGKNREVRRLFEALGYEVEKLDRTRFAGLTHRGMSRGETRALTNSEIHALKRLAGINEE